MGRFGVVAASLVAAVACTDGLNASGRDLGQAETTEFKDYHPTFAVVPPPQCSALYQAFDAIAAERDNLAQVLGGKREGMDVDVLGRPFGIGCAVGSLTESASSGVAIDSARTHVRDSFPDVALFEDKVTETTMDAEGVIASIRCARSTALDGFDPNQVGFSTPSTVDAEESARVDAEEPVRRDPWHGIFSN